MKDQSQGKKWKTLFSDLQNWMGKYVVDLKLQGEK